MVSQDPVCTSHLNCPISYPGINDDTITGTPIMPPDPVKPSQSTSSNGTSLFIGIGVGIGFLVAVLVLYFILRYKCNVCQSNITSVSSSYPSTSPSIQTRGFSSKTVCPDQSFHSAVVTSEVNSLTSNHMLDTSPPMSPPMLPPMSPPKTLGRTIIAVPDPINTSFSPSNNDLSQMPQQHRIYSQTPPMQTPPSRPRIKKYVSAIAVLDSMYPGFASNAPPGTENVPYFTPQPTFAPQEQLYNLYEAQFNIEPIQANETHV